MGKEEEEGDQWGLELNEAFELGAFQVVVRDDIQVEQWIIVHVWEGKEVVMRSF